LHIIHFETLAFIHTKGQHQLREYYFQNLKMLIGTVNRGESKPERRFGKRIIAGTAFRLEFLVRWYYDADATTAVPELY